MDEILHLNEFFVEGGDQNTSHVLLHLTEPSTPEEKLKGYFFAIAELNETPSEIISDVQTLIDDIENAYYETEDTPEKTALETIVASFNAATNLKEPTKNHLHCLVGALRGEEILLTYVGKPITILFYKNKQGQYQQMELLESQNFPEDDNQLFQQFVQGKMGPGDFILLGTPHILDHFNVDRLEKIITTRPSRESAEHFERVLGGLNNNYSFGGLIINRSADLISNPKKIRPLNKEITSAESLRQLISTEKNTSETLSPSFLPRVQEKLRVNSITKKISLDKPAPSPAVNVRSNHLQTHRTRPKANSINTKEALRTIFPLVVRVFKSVLLGFTYFFQLLSLTLLGLARFFGATFFIATNFQGRRRTILENWNREWRSRKENFRQLPLFKKILFFSVIFGIIILILGIILVNHNQKIALEKKQFDENVAVIQLKKDAVESALIYRDENKARIELQSAVSIFKNLPCSTKENIVTCRNLFSALSDLTIKLSKMTPIVGSLLASWDNFNGEFLDVVKLNSRILISSTSTTKLYIYDTVTKEKTTLDTGFVAGLITDLTVPKENDYAVMVINQKDIYFLDPNDWHLKKAEISFPRTVSKISSTVVYNRRLYSLDAGSNHLYKHDAIKNGFGSGKDWITSASSSLSTGVDLAIDGDIYILNKNGVVQKFTSGEKTDWALPDIEPALTTASRIYTYNDVENIYILDSAGKRLIIFKKDGTLKAQLVDKAWVNPTDMIIDEPSYTAYIIDQNKLYKIDLPR